ncbi:hypothetical protein [Enterobacter soli]|uniref:hypothetical protein n=1 Tax=Enterobacter soli TaxID=885040 RepID=UPI0020B8F3E4
MKKRDTSQSALSRLAEAAPHFFYLIRHNSLNRKNSFLLSTFLPRTKLPPARNAS